MKDEDKTKIVELIKELKDSEERLKILFDYAPDAYYISDLKGNFVDCNKQAEKLTGYKKKELIGKNFLKLKLLSITDISKLGKLFDKDLRGLSVETSEFIFNRKNNTKVTVEISTYTVKIKGRTLVLGIVRDITECKQAEQALIESEEKYRTVFENTVIATMVIDEDMTISMVNAQFEKLSGYTKDQIKNKMNLKEFIVPEELEKMRNYHIDRIKPGKNPPTEYEIRLIDKKGNIRNIFMRIGMVPNTKKSIASLMDITERKNAEKNIKSAKDELQAIFDGIEDGICVIDESYQILRANQRMLKIFDKRSFSDLLGKRCFIEYFDNRRICGNCPVQKAFENGESYRLTKIFQKRNKNKVMLDMTAFPLKDDEGRVIQVIVYLKNITDMTEVGELAAGVAHEIKNPLGNIVAAAQFCLFKQQINEKTKNYLEIILRNAESANKIIKQLMTFAKPRELSFKLENTTDVIDRVCILVETMCAKQKVTVIKKWSKSIPPILLDSNLLEQTFLNIILNALDAMPNGGDLTITALVNIEQSEVLVSFIDTGEGISPENLDKVIEPFFTTKETGIGLGLSFVRHAIDCHKGKTSIKSKVGQGTEVWVRFPILR
jgi:PAS domain S-box-containing protein